MLQQGSKRSKVRKGTHSCAECKRRKIKCDRTEYSSASDGDACSQCKARGLASSCRPQYDPRDAPSMSPEPSDIDLRDRVAKLEAALVAITGGKSPSDSSPRGGVGTAVASGTEAAKGFSNPIYSPTSESLYSGSTSVTPSPGTNVSPYSTLAEPGSFNNSKDTQLPSPESACRWLHENHPVVAQVAKQQLSNSSMPNSITPPCSVAFADLDSTDPSGQQITKRTPYESELLSHLPKKAVVDELAEIYFNHTDVCHTTFSPVFYQSYKRLWETPADQSVNVPFLGVLFIAMANAVHVHDGPFADDARATMQLYNRLSNQITDDPQYNLHIETVEAILLQSMFLLNEGKMNNSFLRSRHAIAVAQMLGLHRDPSFYNAKPLQAERARRLWWKLYDMDRALSLFMGRPYTIIDKFVDVQPPMPYEDDQFSESQEGELIISKNKGKSTMYFRFYNDRVSRDIIPDIIDNNFSLQPPDFNKVAVIEARLATLAQSSGPGWNQLLTAKDMAATRTMEEQFQWAHRLASTFWTIQVHSSIHMPFINSRPESKAVCLENARSLMFLYECIRASFTSPGIRNIIAFYGFASAVFLETVSTLPEDKKRVERMKEILEEDAVKSTIAFQAAQVLDFLRTGCRDKQPSQEINRPPPIILPYFGIVRMASDKKNSSGTVPQQGAVLQPQTVAFKAPPPTPTVPQVQDDLSAMNMDGNTSQTSSFAGQGQAMFGDSSFNWDFNFAFDPVLGGSSEIGAMPMDIEAWSSYWNSLNETLLLN